MVTSVLRAFLLIVSVAVAVIKINASERVEDCKAHSRAWASFMGCIICGTAHVRKSFQQYSFSFRSKIEGNTLILSGTNQSNIPLHDPTSILSPTGKVFHEIYFNFDWSTAGGGSGMGSDTGFAVVASHILKLVVYKYGITSLLDAPCGAVSESWTKKAITMIKQDM